MSGDFFVRCAGVSFVSGASKNEDLIRDRSDLSAMSGRASGQTQVKDREVSVCGMLSARHVVGKMSGSWAIGGSESIIASVVRFESSNLNYEQVSRVLAARFTLIQDSRLNEASAVWRKSVGISGSQAVEMDD